MKQRDISHVPNTIIEEHIKKNKLLKARFLQDFYDATAIKTRK